METFERPYKQVSRVKALLLFFFRPKAFVEFAAEHDIAWLLCDSPEIRADYLRGEYKPNVAQHHDDAKQRAEALRRSLLHAAMVVLVTALLGLVTGLLLQRQVGMLATFASNILQAVAVGIILWATLWQLTRDLQSFGGNSLPERVHSWIFNALYIIGTFILFIVYGWQT
ncbi:hypothetical protein [Pelobacter propionicus]|uniref:Uncharacterized protein n=1 Tax=Pelobacter propionicus (strain DSM 2379 / NBRC 103807 / OttBd1) TaxID=338966 RepID=A1AQH5_PELPD|nr:hypothetical protein [Pelobacter propionicus]ABK99595.1 hypothetical protein Ppro_1987 [Pelobacter propionicus DSM 2379]